MLRFLVDETDVTIRGFIEQFRDETELRHPLCHVEFLLVTPQASNRIFFFIGVQCQLPIVDAHFLQEAGEQNLSVHLLTELNGPIRNENLHALVVETA